MQDDDADDQEGQQIVQREEALQGRLIDREAAPQPAHDLVAHKRNRGEEIGDHGCRPEAHLSPGQHIAHEGGRHHEEQNDEAEHPQHLARRLVRAVIEAAEDVDIDHEEEHRGAVRMQIAQEPAVIDVAHDALDGIEGKPGGRNIVHGENDAGQNLEHQGEAREGAEIPPVVQIARCRIGDQRAVEQRQDRQTLLEPAHSLALGLKASRGHGCHPQPMRTRLGVVNSYAGISRFFGAGPLRMRPAVS